MAIELTPEQRLMIERVMHCGGYRDAKEVIGAALEAFAEDTEDATAKEREAAIERLRTFGRTHRLSLGGMTLRELRHEARP